MFKQRIIDPTNLGNDPYSNIVKQNKLTIHNLIYKKNTLKVLGDDGSLKKAINSRSEIMIHANSALYIDIDLYNKYIVPLFNNKEVKDKNNT